MNILVDELPESVVIDGRKFEVNTDFRACLKTIMAFEDDELTGQEKSQVLLSNLFAVLPDNLNAAMEKANWFLNGGDPTPDPSPNSANSERGEQPRLYSFSKDANFIFAAFRQTHGIDLTKAELHWWEFLALFMDLGADTTFCNLVSLRKRVKSGKASKEEKQAAQEMGAAFEIEEIDTRTLDEKIAKAEFMKLVKGN